jgi:hypothetical protein
MHVVSIVLQQLCCRYCFAATVTKLFQNGVVSIFIAWVVEIETCYRNKNMLQELHCS